MIKNQILHKYPWKYILFLPAEFERDRNGSEFKSPHGPFGTPYIKFDTLALDLWDG